MTSLSRSEYYVVNRVSKYVNQTVTYAARTFPQMFKALSKIKLTRNHPEVNQNVLSRYMHFSFFITHC